MQAKAGEQAGIKRELADEHIRKEFEDWKKKQGSDKIT
jgi:hypothetical protein